jgi:hypothetical protein
MQDRYLKLQDVLSNPANGLQEFFRSLLVSQGNLFRADSQGIGIQFHLVEQQAVFQDGIDSLLPDSPADPLHHLGRGEWLTKDLDCSLTALLAEHVTARAESTAHAGQLLLEILLPGIDSLDLEGLFRHGDFS